MSLYGIKRKLNKWWRIWAQSLGEKVGESDRQADFVAMIRTFWWTVHIVTCFFIIAGNSKMLGLW
jgi:hypothetical protein